MSNVPVITIDGPSGAGKGTVAQLLAEQLGYHLLDSGAVYRAAGLHALEKGADLSDEDSMMACLKSMNARFEPHTTGVKVYLDNTDVTLELRSEATAAAASTVAVMPNVRAALLDEQRSFRVDPGLVADGRDMGTAVFPDADLKVFLFASAAVRAARRAKQLKEKGIQVNMESLVQDIAARDERDSSRKHSPLMAASDALVIDSSEIPVARVVQQILAALPANVAVPT
ncbi:MAG: (d)CMP kinase [Granulosicoccus sp.]